MVTQTDPRVSLATLVSVAGLLIAMVCLVALIVINAIRRRRQADARARRSMRQRAGKERPTC